MLTFSFCMMLLLQSVKKEEEVFARIDKEGKQRAGYILRRLADVSNHHSDIKTHTEVKLMWTCTLHRSWWCRSGRSVSYSHISNWTQLAKCTWGTRHHLCRKLCSQRHSCCRPLSWGPALQTLLCLVDRRQFAASHPKPLVSSPASCHLNTPFEQE